MSAMVQKGPSLSTKFWLHLQLIVLLQAIAPLLGQTETAHPEEEQRLVSVGLALDQWIEPAGCRNRNADPETLIRKDRVTPRFLTFGLLLVSILC